MTGNEALVAAVKADYRTAPLDADTRQMLAFAEKVTRAAHEVDEAEIDALRRHGFSDEAILDIVHITGFFNHINRVADALGVDLEDFMIQGRGNSGSTP